MEYSELLQHPFWQKKRLRILERDDFACCKCTDHLVNLQIHHLYYLPDAYPWEYPDDALITLCKICHQKEEFKKWVVQFGIRSLVYHGFIRTDVMEVKELVFRKVDSIHKQEAIRYMEQIKILMTNG